MLSVNVHAANVHDTKSGIIVAKQAFEKYGSVKKAMLGVLAGIEKEKVEEVLNKHKGNIRKALQEVGIDD